MTKEVTQAILGSIQYNQPSEVSHMSDTINSRKILRIKKQFMIVRGALFNKQITVTSLFFWAKYSETQNSRNSFWKCRHQNQDSPPKLISTHFGRPSARGARLEEWGLGIIYIPPKWQLIPEAKESFLFFFLALSSMLLKVLFRRNAFFTLMGNHKISRQIFVSTARPQDMRPLK